MRIRYHKLTKDDLQILTSLIRLYEEVFNMQHFTMPPADYLQSLLQKEHILFYTALVGDEVVGGLTAYVLPSVYFSAAEVYIYDLAVKTEYQRKGIGRQLISELKEHCRQLGHKEIFVQADIDDQHALDFYQATGGQPESVIHYTYRLTNGK